MTALVFVRRRFTSCQKIVKHSSTCAFKWKGKFCCNCRSNNRNVMLVYNLFEYCFLMVDNYEVNILAFLFLQINNCNIRKHKDCSQLLFFEASINGCFCSASQSHVIHMTSAWLPHYIQHYVQHGNHIAYTPVWHDNFITFWQFWPFVGLPIFFVSSHYKT